MHVGLQEREVKEGVKGKYNNFVCENRSHGYKCHGVRVADDCPNENASPALNRPIETRRVFAINPPLIAAPISLKSISLWLHKPAHNGN